jgi:CxxC motif-containing protein
MDLKNISSFDNFKKVFEQSIPTEFSNSTRFSQSLVGRGLFSIFRYFKQSIDIGRLEYLKRKLENEYFAGWLRFCAERQINIKDGTMLETASKVSSDISGGGGGEETEISAAEAFICEILNLDYTDKNQIATTKVRFEESVASLNQLKTEGGIDEEDLAELEEALREATTALEYLKLKEDINNNVFEKLLAEPSGTTFDAEKEKTILELLEKLKGFLSDKAKACSTYHLTDNEKKIIDVIASCTNENVKNKCNEIKSLLTPAPQAQPQAAQPQPQTESLLLEEVVSGNMPIMLVLGDQLNTTATSTSGTTLKKIKPSDYLKSIGINNVSEINWVECAKLFSKNPEFKKIASNRVTLEAVRNIQYAASRIIFRVKKTPTYTGITPEKGGGVDYKEDSALRTTWEKKVDVVKGEWTMFLDFTSYKIDPFRALNLQDAIRSRDANFNNFKEDFDAQTAGIMIEEETTKMGLKLVKAHFKDEGSLIVIDYLLRNKHLWLVFFVESDRLNKERSVYRYVGNIDIDKIRNEKLHEKVDFKKNAKNYAACILDPDYNNKGNKEVNSLLKISRVDLVKDATKYLTGIFLSTADFKRIGINDEGTPRSRRTRIFFLYLDKSVIDREAFSAIKYSTPIDKARVGLETIDLNGNKINVPLPADLKDVNIKNLLDSSVGCMYTFLPTWDEIYFGNLITNINSMKKISHPSILKINDGESFNNVFTLK